VSELLSGLRYQAGEDWVQCHSRCLVLLVQNMTLIMCALIVIITD
jgi:hypothetical protein